MRNPIHCSCFSLLFCAVYLPSSAFAALYDCYFVYQEVPGGTEIPGVPSGVQEGTAVPDCPPGLYDNETWPHDGCKMSCQEDAEYKSICLSFGYVTTEKAVLHMSCGDSIKGSNPDGSDVVNCVENAKWIDSLSSAPTATITSKAGDTYDTVAAAAVVVTDYTCDICQYDAFCVPPFFQNYTGPLAPLEGETLPPSDESGATSVLSSSLLQMVMSTSVFAGIAMLG